MGQRGSTGFVAILLLGVEKTIKEFKPDVILFHWANIFLTYYESSNRTRMACHSRWL